MGAVPAAFGLAGGLGGLAILQGESQKRAQKRAASRQAEAQRLATSRATAEQRRQEQGQRKLNRRKPNTTSLLAEERRAAGTGPGATTLTGAAGVSGEKLTLGKTSLLGGS